MEENIVWNQALTRNKELAGDNIATIANKIMNINNLDSLLLHSDSHAESSCIYDVAKQPKARQDSIGMIYSLEIRKAWNIWICYQ